MRYSVAKFAIVVAFLTLHVYTAVEWVRSDPNEVRTLPKSVWFVVGLIPLIGPVAWLVFGRPQSSRGSGGAGPGRDSGGSRPPRGPVAPDDDPAFLRRLDEQAWASRMERLRREREGGSGPAAPGAGRPEGTSSGSAPEPDAAPDVPPAAPPTAPTEGSPS